MHQKKNVSAFFFVFLVLLPAMLFLARIVSTSYGSPSSTQVSAVPNLIQEGDRTTITVNITAAAPNKTYTLRVNVTNPAKEFSTVNVTVTTDTTGFGSNSTIYRDNFAGATTNLVGNYTIFVKNMTNDETLANTSFRVTLTDRLKYQRGDIVKIQAFGYNNTEEVAVDIKTKGTSVAGYPKNATANDEGLVITVWRIPKNTTPGTYTVSITNTTFGGTVKTPADIQDFEVLGVICQIQTVNLANHTLSDMLVEVYDSDTPNVTLLSGKTNATGWVRFNLDVGNYTFKAFWREVVEVGAIHNVNATEDKVLKLRSQLTNIKILVIDEAGNPVPLISITSNYNYTTRQNVTIPKTESFLINDTGIRELHNMLINISYLFEMRRYDLLFNRTYIERMEASDWFNLTITLPTYTAFIHVVDSKNNPLEDFRVEAYEWSSGFGQPSQSETTNSDGNVTFSISFGKYRVRVSNGTILLYETIVNLTQDQSSFLISLSNYNIDFTVAVIDYFGQPIPNAMVQIERKTGTKYEVTAPPSFTGPDGHVTFKGILGGDSRISIYIRGQLSGTRYLYLTNSKEVTFNLSRYVAIAGYAVEASQFVTAIAIALLIVTFIVALTYKRLLKIFTKSK